MIAESVYIDRLSMAWYCLDIDMSIGYVHALLFFIRPHYKNKYTSHQSFYKFVAKRCKKEIIVGSQ